ncbi:MAG: tetratricopeptide repeat protein [Elusimicrobia bacterium]|nr:tetratricopeptide repeat protein [Elusimicrobiota bacterium]
MSAWRWLALALVLPASLCLAAACRRARETRWQERSVAGLTLYDQGRYQEARPLALEGMRLAEESFGSADLRTAYALDFLGKVERRLGRLERARELFERAVGIAAEALGPDAPQRAHFLDNLAELLTAQGKYDEAEVLYQDSLRLMQRDFGELSVPVSAAYARLAALYVRWGVYEEAEPLVRRLEAINTRVGSSDEAADSAVAAAHCTFHLQAGELDAAWEDCTRALAKRRRLPKNHLDLAEALSAAGLMHLRSGSVEEARACSQKALAIYRERPGADPQGLVESWLTLAEVAAAEGRDAEAEELFAKLLPLYSNPYALVKALARVAGHYQSRGRLDIAERLYLQALAKQVSSPKADKRDREALLMRLAEVSVGLGRHGRAEGYLRRALETNESLHGALDPGSAAIIAALAQVQLARRRPDRAEPWLARLRRLADSRGRDSSVGRDVLRRMARLYERMGRADKAARLQAQVDAGS